MYGIEEECRVCAKTVFLKISSRAFGNSKVVHILTEKNDIGSA